MTATAEPGRQLTIGSRPSSRIQLNTALDPNAYPNASNSLPHGASPRPQISPSRHSSSNQTLDITNVERRLTAVSAASNGSGSSGTLSSTSSNFFPRTTLRTSPSKLQPFSPTEHLRQQAERRERRPVGFKTDADWRNWPEIKIKVTNIPGKSLTTWRIYNDFSVHGTISRIDIAKNRDTFVSYSPPPDVAFWTKGSKYISAEGTSASARCNIEVMPATRSFLTPSPVDPYRKFSELSTLSASSVDFGFMHSESTMMMMRTITPPPGHQVEFMLKLNRKPELVIRFPLVFQSNPNVESYRFAVPLAKISHIYVSQPSPFCKVIILPLDAPPEYEAKTKDIRATHDTYKSTWHEWQVWYRQTDIVQDRARLETTPVRFRKEDDAVIDIGRWTTYRFVFNDSNANEAKFEELFQALTDYNIRIVSTDTPPIEIVPRKETEIWKFLDLPDEDEAKKQDIFTLLLDLEQGVKHLPFEVRYQLEVCLSRGYLNEYNITEEFFRTLASLEDSRAIDILERVADMKTRFFNPMEVFGLRRPQSSARKRLPPYCTLARSAVVTPSMIYYNTPAVEISNRVIRHWSRASDRFLRVRFTDEVNNGRINARENHSQDEIFNRVARVMKNGIVLGDRKYEFLAFGNSQFREHGAYFFAPSDSLTTEEIRVNLGDLNESSDKYLPAKWCARLGQNFSTTRGINVRTIVKPSGVDVKRNGYCFTDGAGKISRDLMRTIAQEFGLPTEDPPSAIQFRLGGCKGVLAVSPGIPSNEIHIRRSQFKFAAIHDGLEVVRTSSYVGAVLNRQIIVVLSALGVKDEVFGKKMEHQLQDLEGAMVDEKVALRELERCIDHNQTTLTIGTLVLNGFMRAKDPFTMSLLRLWRSWSIKFLKEKAKIPIKLGACLLGCVDETATLKGHFEVPDRPRQQTREERIKQLPEVFCYVDRRRKGVYEPIEGICILARNPSLHPGDIRVVHAVDNRRLHHLKNVVVLPQTGYRDLGNMCSGGDLDGDDYLLIWDQDLIPAQWNHPAMDFTPVPPKKLDRVVTVDDMTDFFVTYMKNDRLPTIALAHLAFADYLDLGVKDSKCLALAQLHSQAVDYPKSGMPAIMPRDLRPRMWPHFMEKKHKQKSQQYQSKKILGQLYDIVERVNFIPEYKTPFDQRVLGAFQLDPELLKEAAEVKEDYDAQMKRVMAQHDIGTEFEVWSTFVMSHNDEKRDYSFAEELGNIVSAVKEQFRRICIERAGGEAHIQRFVAAMYTVTAQHVKAAVEKCRQTRIVGGGEVPTGVLDPKEMPLMSFPWLFDRELGKIASGTFHSIDAFETQQPVQQKKPKKILASLLSAEDNAETVKTEAGIVPRGEIFSLPDESTKPEPTQPGEHERMIEAAIQDPKIAIEDSWKPDPRFERSRNGHDGLLWKSDIQDINAMDLNGLFRSRNLPLDFSTSPKMVMNGKENTSPGFRANLLDAYGVEEITIDLDDTKPSALDKLEDLLGEDSFDRE